MMSAQLHDIQMAGRVGRRNDNFAIAENLACRFLESTSTREVSRARFWFLSANDYRLWKFARDAT
jgi:hypothetical protein